MCPKSYTYSLHELNFILVEDKFPPLGHCCARRSSPYLLSILDFFDLPLPFVSRASSLSVLDFPAHPRTGAIILVVVSRSTRAVVMSLLPSTAAVAGPVAALFEARCDIMMAVCCWREADTRPR